MPRGPSERQAEHQRTIAMIRRSADGQTGTLIELAVSAWAARLAPHDLAMIRATASELVTAVPPSEVRCGDLVVRNGDDSFRSFRLISRLTNMGGSGRPPCPPSAARDAPAKPWRPSGAR